MTPRNRHGKPLDDLDILKMQVAMASLVGAHQPYAIESRSGEPICGFWTGAPTPYFIATEWE